MSAPAGATCPRCGSVAPLLPIAYGYPSLEMFEAARRGEIALGGCVVRGEDPTHRCTACGQDVILSEGAETNFAAVEELEAWDETAE
jgi:hypothetical protein